MGTTFTKGAGKADIVNEIRTQGGPGLVDSTVVGSALWTVEDVKLADGTVRRLIGCYLLRSSRGFGWGYKAMDEMDGPSYYNCPLRFLKLQPVAWNEYSANWREKVKAYHKGSLARKQTLREVQAGDTIELRPTCKPHTLTCTAVLRVDGRVSRIIGRDEHGNTYRIPKTYIVGYSRGADNKASEAEGV